MMHHAARCIRMNRMHFRHKRAQRAQRIRKSARVGNRQSGKPLRTLREETFDWAVAKLVRVWMSGDSSKASQPWLRDYLRGRAIASATAGPLREEIRIRPLQGLTALATIMNCLTRRTVPYVALCGNSSEWLATKDHQPSPGLWLAGKELKGRFYVSFVLYAFYCGKRTPNLCVPCALCVRQSERRHSKASRPCLPAPCRAFGFARRAKAAEVVPWCLPSWPS